MPDSKIDIHEISLPWTKTAFTHGETIERDHKTTNTNTKVIAANTFVKTDLSEHRTTLDVQENPKKEKKEVVRRLVIKIYKQRVKGLKSRLEKNQNQNLKIQSYCSIGNLYPALLT